MGLAPRALRLPSRFATMAGFDESKPATGAFVSVDYFSSQALSK